MGDRAQVKIIDGYGNPPVYLYTHWRGTGLQETVKRVIARGQRLDDPEYLARIILNEMQGNDRGETGFGISTTENPDLQHPIVVVNCAKRTLNGIPFSTLTAKGEES